MTVLWVDIPDDPGLSTMRAYIERNSTGLLSNRRRPVDPLNGAWLGHHNIRPEIRSSGLWNLNHIDEAYDPAFLDVFEDFVRQQGSEG